VQVRIMEVGMLSACGLPLRLSATQPACRCHSSRPGFVAADPHLIAFDCVTVDFQTVKSGESLFGERED